MKLFSTIVAALNFPVGKLQNSDPIDGAQFDTHSSIVAQITQKLSRVFGRNAEKFSHSLRSNVAGGESSSQWIAKFSSVVISTQAYEFIAKNR